MSKILYIGVFEDGTGYSTAALNHLLAMDSVGLDVVARPIHLNDRRVRLSERYYKLKEKSLNGVDTVIQHVLPSMTESLGPQRHICNFTCEVSNFKSSGWTEYLNLMDESWVPCGQNRCACVNSGVKTPVHIVPYAFDMSKYQRSYKKTVTKLDDSFIFYFVGEFNRRKNLSALIKAFHLEFDPSEPVELLIKTTLNQPNPDQFVRDYCDKIKSDLKLYPNLHTYKREIINTQFISEDEMMGLHLSCDCIVSPSYGEGWHIPTFEALALGRGVIASNSTGFNQYLDKSNSWLVPVREEPCWGMTESPYSLYKSDQNWFSPDILSLRGSMREAYSDREMLAAKKLSGMEGVYRFDYREVGGLISKLV